MTTHTHIQVSLQQYDNKTKISFSFFLASGGWLGMCVPLEESSFYVGCVSSFDYVLANLKERHVN